MGKRNQIDLEALVKLSSVVAITPSCAGDKIAFYADYTGRFELYVMDLTTQEKLQITHGEAPRAIRSGLIWTRDDASIIFAKDKDGDEHNNLYRIELAGGAITQLNDDPDTQEYAVQVHPDNRTLTAISTRSGQANIHLVDLETLEWTQLTDYKRPAGAGEWSPDGEWLAFGTNETNDFKNLDGYLIKRDGSETRKILDTGASSHDMLGSWHPDGKHIAISSDVSGVSQPGVLNIETGEIHWFGKAGIDEYVGSFSKDGLYLSAVRNRESAFMPVYYDVETGEEHALKLPPGMASGTRFVLGDTKLLVSHVASNRRAEVLLYDLASDTYDVLIAADHGEINPDIFVTAEHIYYPSCDGRMVPAILYRPREIEPGEKLPAVVAAHGGPTGQWYLGFDPYAQFLVDRGYAVLEPNVRGSTGYGTEWRDANLKDWGGGDLEDLAAGAEYLKSLDYVDGSRLAVYGGSYGGYMTYISVTKKPDLFKVGIPIVGITDLFKLYEEDMPHFQYYLEQQMGLPSENVELWTDRSAVTHAEALKAKLLIIHGINDPRCPISQARGFRDKLLALGRREGMGADADFEYHEFEDEGHGPGGDIEQKVRHYRLLVDFLERRL